MDIFEQDPFSEVAVLDRILNRPFKPQYLTNLLRPQIVRCFTEDFSVIKSNGGEIRVLDYSPRGAPLQQNRLARRRMNKIPIPRFGEGFTVNYDQKRSISNQAMDGGLEQAQTLVDTHLEQVNDNMDVTVEHQLVHAVRGYITDAEQNVEIDLHEELGSKQQHIVIDVKDSSRPWIRQVQDAKSMSSDGMRGEVVPSFTMLPGASVQSFFESDKTYNQAGTSDLAIRLSIEDNREGVRLQRDLLVAPSRRGYFDPFECYLVPDNTGFFRQVLGPSDAEQYADQVLERYVTRENLKHGGGWEYQVTEFCLQYARKPAGIVRVYFKGIGDPGEVDNWGLDD